MHNDFNLQCWIFHIMVVNGNWVRVQVDAMNSNFCVIKNRRGLALGVKCTLFCFIRTQVSFCNQKRNM